MSSSIDEVVEQETIILTSEICDAVKAAVDRILEPPLDLMGAARGEPSLPGEINIGDPQPPDERPIPVEPGTKEFIAVVVAINTIIARLESALELGFLMPVHFEGPLRLSLLGAYRTIRAWLD